LFVFSGLLVFVKRHRSQVEKVWDELDSNDVEIGGGQCHLRRW